MRHLVARAKKSHRAHAIVMAVVIAVALEPASVSSRPILSGARPSMPQELVTIPEPAADSAMPGFALLPATGDFSAGAH
jgi:hypothetical protein